MHELFTREVEDDGKKVWEDAKIKRGRKIKKMLEQVGRTYKF